MTELAFDTSWIGSFVNTILQISWDLTFGSSGIITILFNMTPLGNNSLTIETWFYIAVFIGPGIFIRYYGNGIIYKIIDIGLNGR